MQQLFLTALALLAIAISPAWAGHADATGHDIAIKVNGLVCDFCAQAIDKVFRKNAAVEDVNVNLDNGIITVDFTEGQSITDERLTEMVTDAGYNVTEIIHQ